MASLGIRRFEDLIGRTDLLDMDDGDRALEGPPRRPVDGARDRPSCRRARRAAAPAPSSRCSTTRSTGSSCAAARRRSSSGETVRLGPIPVRNVNRTVGGILSGEIARRHGAERPARGHDRDLVHRLGRPELRRLARPRGDVLAARRDQRLRRQGPVRRGRVGPPAREAPLPRRGEHDRRQHRAVRRHRRAGVLPRAGRRALRGAQLGRARGRRGRRRPRLRVHDRRPRRRARAARAGTSPPG